MSLDLPGTTFAPQINQPNTTPLPTLFETLKGRFAVLGPVRVSKPVVVEGRTVYDIERGRIEFMAGNVVDFDQFTRIEIYRTAVYTFRKGGIGLVLRDLRDPEEPIPVERIVREAVELEWPQDYRKLYMLEVDDDYIREITTMYKSNREEDIKVALLNDFVLKIAVLETLATDSGIRIGNFLGVAYVVDGHTFGTPAPVIFGIPVKVYRGAVTSMVFAPKDSRLRGPEFYEIILKASEFISEFVRTQYQFIMSRISEVKQRYGLRDRVTKSMIETLQRMVGFTHS